MSNNAMGLTKPPRILPPEDLVERTEEDVSVYRAKDASLQALGVTIGDLKDALVLKDSPKAKEFLAALCNPKYKNWSTAKLAGKFGISPMAIIEIIQKSYLSKGLLNMARGVPMVSQDIVEDAKSQFVTCDKCDGEGEIEKNEERIVCPNCKGQSTIRRQGDSESRKLMFEALGYKQRGAPLVQQTFISGNHIESMVNEMEDNSADTTASILEAFKE